MTACLKTVPGSVPAQEDRSVLSEVNALLGFDGPPDRFLAGMIDLQCRHTGADGCVVLRSEGKDGLEVLAMHPAAMDANGNANWIDAARKYAHEVFSSGETMVWREHPICEGEDRACGHLVIVPILKEQGIRALAAFLVNVKNLDDVRRCRERLEITSFLLNVYEMRWSLKERFSSFDRLQSSLEVLSAVSSSNRFMNAAMAMCNEMATRWQCHRVSLGFLNNRHVQVQAMSYTDKFDRKMKLLQGIEAAMEECLDQDLEVRYPASDTEQQVNRTAAALSSDHGPSAILSLPIRQNGDVSAVLTLERSPDRPFDNLNEIEAARLTCDLCATRLVELHENDRWFGARMAASARKGFSLIIGPKHTWLKICAVMIISICTFLVYAKGEYRIEAPFVFEAPVQQSVVAPFKTYIKRVSVAPGDQVEAGITELGELETSEIRLKLAALKAEMLGYQKQMAAAMRDRKTAEAQISEAKSDKVAAEIRLLEQNVGQARLVAPISGRVISEDLQRQIGAPVEPGKILFEIARIESLRAELYVPEDLIADLNVGQSGELASVSHPDRRIRFVVERVNPIADVVENQNVFRVRAKLLEQYDWMRPGMEGVAKIAVEERSYGWIATHRLANWLRMKLWL